MGDSSKSLRSGRRSSEGTVETVETGGNGGQDARGRSREGRRISARDYRRIDWQPSGSRSPRSALTQFAGPLPRGLFVAVGCVAVRYIVIAYIVFACIAPECGGSMANGIAVANELPGIQNPVASNMVDESVLAAAASNRAEIERALRDVPPAEAAGMSFLIQDMPPGDLRSLTAEFLLDHCRLAYQAKSEHAWAAAVPEPVFLNHVLPYASVSERRDPWRSDLRQRCLPIVKNATTATEAVTAINRELFRQVGVKYSTKRIRPDQSPAESMQSGLASCTGLSILLIDACRSVGIPARFVGTPNWSDGSGNHSWVEFWDDGWHFTGAAEPTGSRVDQGWFTQRAAKADRDDPQHAIYAVSFAATPLVFPMSWNRSNRDVHAVNVTDRYTADRDRHSIAEGMGVARFVVKDANGQRVSRSIRIRQGSTEIFRGVTNDERFDANDHTSTSLTMGAQYTIVAGDGDDSVTRQWRFEADESLLVIHWISKAGLSRNAIKQLRSRLKDEPSPSPDLTSWAAAEVPLTAKDAVTARNLLARHRAVAIARDRAAEIAAQEVVIGERRMKYDIKRFGNPPAAGRSLYISLHGGGGTEPHVNDKQWRNQQKLYQPLEGLYVAPRAPTNTWDLWHQSHVDDLIDRLIENLAVSENVNRDRVYILGYSAGGDGVYQLAPRMADRWAAAAMMAGHPNDASALSLRNVPFALQVGGNDAAFERNEVAKRWSSRLAELNQADPGGYQHFSKVYEGLGHWMNGRDAVAIEWMARHTRQPTPTKIVWHQDDRLHTDSYWLSVDKSRAKPTDVIEAEVIDNTIELNFSRKGIAEIKGIAGVTVRLDDRFIDLDEPVVIVADQVEWFRGEVPRTIATLSQTLARRGDPSLCFPATVTLTQPGL